MSAVHVPSRSCGIGPTSVLTDSGIGILSIGATVPQIGESCEIVGDAVDTVGDGSFVRWMQVRLAPGTAYVVIDHGSVWRIEWNSPLIATADSLRVGTPLLRLLAFPKIAGLEGEGALFTRIEAHCGISFRLSYRPTGEEHLDQWNRAALERLPAGTTVDRILITGCHQKQR